jgi:outer membrane receptor protein involved in Fe transport
MKYLVLLVAACVAAAPVAAAESLAPGASVSRPSLRAGTTLEAALTALNAQGHRIVYSSALVQPGMKLAAAPRATELGALLAEMLAPFNLRALRESDGSWLIVTAPGADAKAAPIVVTEDIETIDVTASRFGLANSGGHSTFLKREEVESMPHLGDDAMRMLKVMPGVTGGDFTAAINVRGGRRDEVNLSIDGAEIHNAFHFRDLDGAMSVLDTTLVQGIDFITGGMTSEYGDYMSAIVNLESRRSQPEDEYNHAVGVSFVSAYARTAGTFADGRGSWLTALRRGFLDVLLERVNEDDETITPRYTDLFSALDYEFGDDTLLSARLLVSDDDLVLVTADNEDNEQADSAGSGQSAHLWFTLDHRFSDELRSKTLLGAARATQERQSAGEDHKRRGMVSSDNQFDYFDLKSDWSWSASDEHLIRWGARFMQERADYNYLVDGEIIDPFVTAVPIVINYSTVGTFEGSRIGAYGSWRMRLDKHITAEIGGRWDQYSYPGDLKFDVFSPRLNFVYSFTDRDDLRAAFSTVYQPHGIDQLQVEDNLLQYFEPERVDQAVLGYTRRFGYGISARVDVYSKQYSHLRPRFENALDTMQLIPESSIDRVRIDATEAEAVGVELTVRREASRGFAGWATFAVAKATDDEAGRDVPRSWEQRQTFSFGGGWTGEKWHFGFAGLFNSGMPTTYVGANINQPPGGGGYTVVPVVGERNGDRFKSYSRFDFRTSRDVKMKQGKLSFYLEFTNLFNAENECCIEDYGIESDFQGNPVFYRENSYWLPMLPSFGFQYDF